MLEIDGSAGEGGGQVLRTSLALAVATGRSVRIRNVRAKRPQPGLKPGHVAAALALAELSGGRLDGAEIGNDVVTLDLDDARPPTRDEFAFRIGTAGPVTLLAQAILPACVVMDRPVTLHLEGGTDVAWAPRWDAYVAGHLSWLQRCGIDIEATLGRRGFFPAGGGRVTFALGRRVAPARLDATHKARQPRIEGHIAMHGLPRHVAARCRDAVADAGLLVQAWHEDSHRGPGTGFALTLVARERDSVWCADVVGRKGVPVERLAKDCVRTLRLDLDRGAGVDIHQADQLPSLLALGVGGTFTTRQLSGHARTVLDLIPRFLPTLEVDVTTLASGLLHVDIRHA